MSDNNLTITERLTNVSERANALCDTVQNQMGLINQALDSKSTELDTQYENFKAGMAESINGLNVYKEGLTKRFSFKQHLSAGGYTSAADGPDESYRYCVAPKDPYYINLIEFDAQHIGNSFGSDGDTFKCDFVMSHRGMATYYDHLVIYGASSHDCVSARIEVKHIMHDTALKLFISEPGEAPRFIDITKADVGKTLTVFFRQIGKGYGNGIGRVSLFVDTRPHCGSERAFTATCEYTSVNGRPCAERVSHNQPSWEQ
ncbi:hypothetical protein N473_12080 [Pseudoalteromonas luteoviolacea CPMOR-1]|uniref:Uncharacterized protein n=1 Tax=Pseudoalteromonas luteoviolacea CPMOR-1 TaxID=1365248 RepID=A0A167M3S8_9GAMM|nr:hypothetical protein [Pseudoalteromonas luteoviolacea]KZN65756.1 hypothetical protein N473_12080 [Pseudoalteromonas luteoviolacea CPMOR-1]